MDIQGLDCKKKCESGLDGLTATDEVGVLDEELFGLVMLMKED